MNRVKQHQMVYAALKGKMEGSQGELHALARPPRHRNKGKNMSTTTTEADAHEAIKAEIESNDVVLFMKGTAPMPQCGFSNRVAGGVLNYLGVAYKDVNVLADEGIRNGIKSFSDWPTIPQLYVKGEFVGGCDIITEMTLSGELDALLAEKGIAFDKAAAEKIREANR